MVRVRIKVKVRVSVMVRVSIRTNWTPALVPSVSGPKYVHRGQPTTVLMHSYPAYE